MKLSCRARRTFSKEAPVSSVLKSYPIGKKLASARVLLLYWSFASNQQLGFGNLPLDHRS
jgi:hypothetical protein